VTARDVVSISTRHAFRGAAADDEVMIMANALGKAPSAPSPHPSLLPQAEKGYVFAMRASIRFRTSRTPLHVVSAS